MAVFGYARVSTDGQTLASQDAELMAAGCAKVYQEKVSGARTDRAELAKVMKRLERDDLLIHHAAPLDRDPGLPRETPVPLEGRHDHLARRDVRDARFSGGVDRRLVPGSLRQQPGRAGTEPAAGGRAFGDCDLYGAGHIDV